jgi:hypothetical protein
VSRRVGDLAGDSIRTNDGVFVDLLINDDRNCNDLFSQNNNLGDELAQTALLKIFGRDDGSSICDSQARSESKRGRETHDSCVWLRQEMKMNMMREGSLLAHWTYICLGAQRRITPQTW